MTRWRLLPVDDRKPYRAGTERRLHGAGTVRIDTVELLFLADVTHDHARRLGHKGTAAFKRAWLERYDKVWLERDLRGDQEQLDRFATRWAHHPVVLVGYVTVERPIYLAPAGSGSDYTPSPGRSIDPDASCVPPREIDALRAAATRENFKAALEQGRREQRAHRGRALGRAA